MCDYVRRPVIKLSRFLLKVVIQQVSLYNPYQIVGFVFQEVHIFRWEAMTSHFAVHVCPVSNQLRVTLKEVAISGKLQIPSLESQKLVQDVNQHTIKQTINPRFTLLMAPVGYNTTSGQIVHQFFLFILAFIKFQCLGSSAVEDRRVCLSIIRPRASPNLIPVLVMMFAFIARSPIPPVLMVCSSASSASLGCSFQFK